jgi:hypothetical protein
MIKHSHYSLNGTFAYTIYRSWSFNHRQNVVVLMFEFFLSDLANCRYFADMSGCMTPNRFPSVSVQ